MIKTRPGGYEGTQKEKTAEQSNKKGVMKMAKKFDLLKNTISISYKNEKKIAPGCTLDQDWADPEKVKSFDNKEDAPSELKNYESEIRYSSGYYHVTEYYVEEYECDEDGEFIEGGDIWDFSQMKIDLIDEDYEVVGTFETMKDALESMRKSDKEGLRVDIR